MKSGERGWKRWREEESDAEIAEGKRGKDVDCRVGVGNHRVTRETLPMVLMISRYSDSATSSILLDNPITMHHDMSNS